MALVPEFCGRLELGTLKFRVALVTCQLAFASIQTKLTDEVKICDTKICPGITFASLDMVPSPQIINQPKVLVFLSCCKWFGLSESIISALNLAILN